MTCHMRLQAPHLNLWIVARGDVPAEKLEGRLARATAELEEGPTLADHVIVNNDGQDGLDQAISEILSLLPR